MNGENKKKLNATFDGNRIELPCHKNAKDFQVEKED